MNNKSGKATGGGIGVSTVLFLIFLVLKLVGVIDWSWWWVTAPIWMPIALGVVIFIVAFIVLLIINCHRNKNNLF